MARGSRFARSTLQDPPSVSHFVLRINEVSVRANEMTFVSQFTESHFILQINEVLVGADEMAATILLVARFGRFIAERLFLAVADCA